MHRTAVLLVLLCVLFVGVSHARLNENKFKTLQAQQGGSDTKGDDSVDVKIIRCCINKFTECEPGFCAGVEKDQAAALKSLKEAAPAIEIPNGNDDIDMDELAKQHEEADKIQVENLQATFLEMAAMTQEQLAYRLAWPNGIIPYKFQTADAAAGGCPLKLSDAVKFVFLTAINEFHKSSCLRWHEDNAAANAITIGSNAKGSNTNGLGTAATRLCINKTPGNGHMQLSTLIHEMGHIAGFAHTHKRSDVATYITFNDAGIETYSRRACGNNPAHTYANNACMRNWRYQFKADADELDATNAARYLTTVANTNYDYKSVMHYPFNVSSIQMMIPDAAHYGRQKTANGNKEIKPGTYSLTPNDLDAIRKLYGCLHLTIQGKRGSASLVDKKAYFGKTQPIEMVKHIIEEHMNLDETTVAVTKSDGTAIAGTLDAAGVADGDTIKASVA